MTLRRTFCFVFAAAALMSAAALWADPPSRVGRINLIDGQVSFRPAGLDEWAPATLNYPLTTGDQIWTDESSQAEIHIGDAAVRLAPATDLSILLLDDQSVQLQLSAGTLNVRLRRLDAGDSFEIATPGASVAFAEPGSYKLDVDDEGTSIVVVRSGRADLASDVSSVPVFPGQEVTVTDAAAADFQVSPAPPLDDWDRWCALRDQREDRFASDPYVSESMVGYEDLDAYGSWESSASYGTVWAPRSLPAGWAPYRFGHWAWVDPWGWTWIDDAPWGFAPFHYGRWAFVAGAWVWVPGPRVARPVYAPALVVFIGGGSRGPVIRGEEGVGWFPLAPHEVYVPPYTVSTTYVNRINIDLGPGIRINTDIARAHYANRSVGGAATFVSRNAFLRSEPAYRVAVRTTGTELRQMPVTGMGPQLVPLRESVLGRPERPAGSVPRPPAEIGRRPVVVRRAPPPAPMPFEERQRQILSRPDRPFDFTPDVKQPRTEGNARSDFRLVEPARPPQPGRPQIEGRLQPERPLPQSPEQRFQRRDEGPAEQGPPRGADQPVVRGQPEVRQPPRGGPTMEAPSRGERPSADAGPARGKQKVRKFVNGHWVESEQDDSGGGRGRN